MRALAIGAWFCGLAVLGWIGQAYIAHSPLALAMTAVIAAVYLMGTRELWRLHRASDSLRQALLLAELAHRLQPVDGLLRALGHAPTGAA